MVSPDSELQATRSKLRATKLKSGLQYREQLGLQAEVRSQLKLIAKTAKEGCRFLSDKSV